MLGGFRGRGLLLRFLGGECGGCVCRDGDDGLRGDGGGFQNCSLMLWGSLLLHHLQKRIACCL